MQKTQLEEEHTRELYQITKRLAGKKSTQPQHVLSKDGETLTSPKEQLERWREHFQDLLNRLVPPNPADIPRAHRTLNVNVDPPSNAETERAVKKLKANRAAGPDEIPLEALKADTTTTSKALHALFKKIWTSEEMPNDWKHGHLIKLPKKGNLKEGTREGLTENPTGEDQGRSGEGALTTR